jgi:hypothetical protein
MQARRGLAANSCNRPRRPAVFPVKAQQDGTSHGAQTMRMMRMKPMLRAAGAAAALLAFAGAAAAMTSGAMPADEPITANTTLHDGTRTSVPMLAARVSAHSDLVLTADQKHRLWRRLAGRNGDHAPAGFEPRVGGEAPAAVKLARLPRHLTAYVPAVAGMRFAKLDGKLLLVRPSDRQIEQVITRRQMKS